MTVQQTPCFEFIIMITPIRWLQFAMKRIIPFICTTRLVFKVGVTFYLTNIFTRYNSNKLAIESNKLAIFIFFTFRKLKNKNPLIFYVNVYRNNDEYF